jgi:signal transduction histidine kinase
VSAVPLGLWARRRSVRMRITVLYIGTFLASAACLLVITYFLVAGQLPAPVTATSGGIAILGGSGQVATSGPSITTACGPAQAGSVPAPSQLSGCEVLIQRAAAGLRADTLNQLLIESGIALGIMAVASVGLGWLLAGRVLSPLRTITAAARRISARNLHQRIAMTGPDDELKELGDTFDRLLGRLDASFRAQRQFVANASHELRTPLARQRTLLEVALRDRDATAACLRAACERALVAGEQQERLIEALLTLARGERGLEAFEPFDLAAVADGVLAARRDDAQDRTLSLVADLAPAAAAGDPGLAERLVANLVDNAVRYNTPGGRVEVTTGTRADRAFLAVANTGPVIAPDQLGRLFRPFQRMDPARRAPGGLGLGLAIVSAIAAAHGAELQAVTRAAGGLAIEIVFPDSATLVSGHISARSLFFRIFLLRAAGCPLQAGPSVLPPGGARHHAERNEETDDQQHHYDGVRRRPAGRCRRARAPVQGVGSQRRRGVRGRLHRRRQRDHRPGCLAQNGDP